MVDHESELKRTRHVMDEPLKETEGGGEYLTVTGEAPAVIRGVEEKTWRFGAIGWVWEAEEGVEKEEEEEKRFEEGGDVVDANCTDRECLKGVMSAGYRG